MSGSDDRDCGRRDGGARAGGADLRSIVYCLVPRDLAPKLLDALRRFFRDDPSVEVVVERRGRERRSGGDRRAAGPPATARAERRAIHAEGGRRVGDRRAPVTEAQAPRLPAKARRHAGRLVFVERLEPAGEEAEDLDTARLVARVQAGDSEVFSDLYLRYFDRVYAYLHVLFKNTHDAEDATQQVFVKVFESLSRYERRRQPFRAWLFRVVRNHALDLLERQSRLDVLDPAEIARRRERSGSEENELRTLSWISDRDLVVLIERLPVAQRQVLVLRYLLDLRTSEIAAVLGRTRTDVSTLHYRAVGFLRDRLGAVGRTAEARDDRARMQRWGKPASVLRSRRFALTNR